MGLIEEGRRTAGEAKKSMRILVKEGKTTVKRTINEGDQVVRKTLENIQKKR